MKKSLFVSLAMVSIFLAPLHHSIQAAGSTNLVAENITMTSAIISLNVGSDQYQPLVTNRQPLKIKYRPWNSDDGSDPQLNGTEQEIPFSYNLDSLQSITLDHLQTNQKYIVWLGHQTIRQCITDTPCTAIYTLYDSTPYIFSTKLDPSKVTLITKNLSFESKSPSVALLKKYLIAKGYMTESSSTTFDIPTLVGVIKFQIANNVTTDGVVGSGSRAIINQWLTNQAQH